MEKKYIYINSKNIREFFLNEFNKVARKATETRTTKT